MKTVFVTVGTTSFDDLISTISSNKALNFLKECEFERIVIQYGKGQPPNFISSSVLDTDERVVSGVCLEEMKYSAYRFKSSLQEDMKEASLIISHAGAGSVLEGLSMKKDMMVVINSSLMDNHQKELAYAMKRRNHCMCVDRPTDLLLLSTWKEITSFRATHFDGIPWENVAEKIDETMGFLNSSS
eukprot:CAMPEP_0116058274 /NCGR_PEP_ID=MMETSP0322-20121206/5105_1 /TAXON_ID=163516 /ORGANISM="Leptocylindrus danicus var. apora, Strain B651" /LENGTH=185 /DNA_ID=CAMNT_0003542437 /DNA_START=107 /DNA_END=664 /DNA_ORIENTATION=+